MATIVIAIFVLILSSLFFAIQTMPQLYKLNAVGKKFFLGFLIFFLLAPCFVLAFYYIIKQYEFNIWLVAPAGFVALMWLAIGFLAKVAYKTLTEVNPKRKRVPFTTELIKKRYKFSCLFLVLAVVIWIFGYAHGFGKYEYAFVLLFFYFTIQGIAFILGNRKAVADGKIKDPEPNNTAETDESHEDEQVSASGREQEKTKKQN